MDISAEITCIVVSTILIALYCWYCSAGIRSMVYQKRFNDSYGNYHIDTYVNMSVNIIELYNDTLYGEYQKKYTVENPTYYINFESRNNCTVIFLMGDEQHINYYLEHFIDIFVNSFMDDGEPPVVPFDISIDAHRPSYEPLGKDITANENKPYVGIYIKCNTNINSTQGYSYDYSDDNPVNYPLYTILYDDPSMVLSTNILKLGPGTTIGLILCGIGIVIVIFACIVSISALKDEVSIYKGARKQRLRQLTSQNSHQHHNNHNNHHNNHTDTSSDTSSESQIDNNQNTYQNTSFDIESDPIN